MLIIKKNFIHCGPCWTPLQYRAHIQEHTLSPSIYYTKKEFYPLCSLLDPFAVQDHTFKTVRAAQIELDGLKKKTTKKRVRQNDGRIGKEVGLGGAGEDRWIWSNYPVQNS